MALKDVSGVVQSTGNYSMPMSFCLWSDTAKSFNYALKILLSLGRLDVNESDAPFFFDPAGGLSLT